jgi:hypothetical protein
MEMERIMGTLQVSGFVKGRPTSGQFIPKPDGEIHPPKDGSIGTAAE